MAVGIIVGAVVVDLIVRYVSSRRRRTRIRKLRANALYGKGKV